MLSDRHADLYREVRRKTAVSVVFRTLNLLSRVAVEKLRLDGTPTPRSWVGSDDEAADTHRCPQERLPQ